MRLTDPMTRRRLTNYYLTHFWIILISNSLSWLMQRLSAMLQGEGDLIQEFGPIIYSKSELLCLTITDNLSCRFITLIGVFARITFYTLFSFWSTSWTILRIRLITNILLGWWTGDSGHPSITSSHLNLQTIKVLETKRTKFKCMKLNSVYFSTPLISILKKEHKNFLRAFSTQYTCFLHMKRSKLTSRQRNSKLLAILIQNILSYLACCG